MGRLEFSSRGTSIEPVFLNVLRYKTNKCAVRSAGRAAIHRAKKIPAKIRYFMANVARISTSPFYSEQGVNALALVGGVYSFTPPNFGENVIRVIQRCECSTIITFHKSG